MGQGCGYQGSACGWSGLDRVIGGRPRVLEAGPHPFNLQGWNSTSSPTHLTLVPTTHTCTPFSKMMRALGRSPCFSYSLAKATHSVCGLPTARSGSTVFTASAGGAGEGLAV